MADRIYEHFVIVFLDLLGQQDALRRIDHTPTSEDELLEDARRVDELLQVVLGIRKGLQDFIAKYRDFPIPLRTFVRGFSDSFVLCVPLSGEGRSVESLASVRSVLTAAAAMMMQCLARRTPLRGGIDVGLGTRLEEGEVYGPALARSYWLEGSAGGPRILVGSTLKSYLTAMTRHDMSSRADSDVRKLATRCCEFLGQDSDGKDILDFAGPGIIGNYVGTGRREMFGKALQFASDQHAVFRNARNEKLAERYGRLVAYLEARAKPWRADGGGLAG